MPAPTRVRFVSARRGIVPDGACSWFLPTIPWSRSETLAEPGVPGRAEYQ